MLTVANNSLATFFDFVTGTLMEVDCDVTPSSFLSTARAPTPHEVTHWFVKGCF